jgi:hypothetical protein
MYLIVILLALFIIAGLAFYAGSLLFKLRNQKLIQQQNIRNRIDNMTESIQTIAKAMEQQQCNLSEGCIRLFHLLEGLPLVNRPDFPQQFPGLYTLYAQVKDLPTHQDRKEQGKRETKRQDTQREELESQLESQILNEMSVLKEFTA